LLIRAYRLTRLKIVVSPPCHQTKLNKWQWLRGMNLSPGSPGPASPRREAAACYSSLDHAGQWQAGPPGPARLVHAGYHRHVRGEIAPGRHRDSGGEIARTPSAGHIHRDRDQHQGSARISIGQGSVVVPHCVTVAASMVPSAGNGYSPRIGIEGAIRGPSARECPKVASCAPDKDQLVRGTPPCGIWARRQGSQTAAGRA